MDLKQENIVEQLLQDTEIKVQREVDVVLLNKGEPVMFYDAFRLWPASGEIEKFCYYSPDTDQYEDDKKHPGVVLSLNEEDLIFFYETRPNSKTHLPNGIQLNRDDTISLFVVFYNFGAEPLTAEGKWLNQGEFKKIVP